MRFCRDKDSDGWFWADREIDAKADHFDPCPVCRAGLEVEGLGGETWFDFSPCFPCLSRLEVDGSMVERGERPNILDRGPLRYAPDKDPFGPSDDEEADRWPGEGRW